MKNLTSHPAEITFDNMPQAVAKVCDEVSLIRKQITELKEKFEPKAPIEYLSRAQVAKMLSCDLSTIHNYCKKHKLIPYGIAGRVYFKRSEVEAALIPLNPSVKVTENKQ